MSDKRNQLQIIVQFLQLCKNPKRQHEVLFKVNMSSKSFQIYRDMLVGLKLLKPVDGDGGKWRKRKVIAYLTTEKGNDFNKLLDIKK